MNALYRTKKMPGYRAQAIVEFAIVLPILMMLLVGILEVGRMIYTYAVVTNASRDAARSPDRLGDVAHARRAASPRMDGLALGSSAAEDACAPALAPRSVVTEGQRGCGRSSMR